MAKSLIIVESPAKTKTLKNFLGAKYGIEASMGHVRDLPAKRLGVDIERGFRPEYVTIPERKTVLKRLKEAAAKADEVYLATDPDREGEAIAWHLVHALRLKNARRITFNEITRSAVVEALEHPRDVDERLFNAQQARRILDRLVGYKLSPLLWTKVRKGLSAGRVQSVAVRLICEREREIEAFEPEEYWSLTARLTKLTEEKPFLAKLTEKDGKKIKPSNEDEANQILRDLEGAEYTVKSVKRQTKRKNPAPPFITSTLQQEASRKLGFSNKKTMIVAQELYEGVELGPEGSVGLITYMRTDSTRISREAIEQARECILKDYGKEYLPSSPRQYRSRKSAQDAHEAIRPTDVCRRPEMLESVLTKDQLRLYRLIWQRFLASQMESAVLDVTTADIQAGSYTFRATGSAVKFDGFTVLYTESKDNGNGKEKADEEQQLPHLEKAETLRLIELTPRQHFTEPPPRYNEATLVKALEEKGIGRPSTYASIISTIQERNYVVLQDRRFKPTELGCSVTDQLVKCFPVEMDVEFTAGVETRLDEIEEGKTDWVGVLESFWTPFRKRLEEAQGCMERLKKPPVETAEKCPNCGQAMVIRESKFGQFLGCSRYPACKTIATKRLGEACPVPGCTGTVVEDKPGSRKLRCSNAPECRYVSVANGNGENGGPTAPEMTDQKCPRCGKPLVKRSGRRGVFLGCSGFPKCRFAQDIPQEENGEPSEDSQQGFEAIMPCPEEGCGGSIVRKKSRYGYFYACDQYPRCKYALAGRPLDKKCPECGGMLVERQYKGVSRGIRCIGDECGYKESSDDQADSGSDEE